MTWPPECGGRPGARGYTVRCRQVWRRDPLRFARLAERWRGAPAWLPSTPHPHLVAAPSARPAWELGQEWAPAYVVASAFPLAGERPLAAATEENAPDPPVEPEWAVRGCDSDPPRLQPRLPTTSPPRWKRCARGRLARRAWAGTRAAERVVQLFCSPREPGLGSRRPD